MMLRHAREEGGEAYIVEMFSLPFDAGIDFLSALRITDCAKEV